MILKKQEDIEYSIPMICERCDYKWNFKGTRRTRAGCPDCGKQNKIRDGKQIFE